MDDKTKLEVGLQTRREVLGAEYVDRSLGQASDFARPMQELVTEYCWGAVWSRPGLDRKRSQPAEYRHAHCSRAPA